MDNEIAIKAENVSKKYCKSIKDSMFYGLTDIGRNVLGLASHSDKLKKNEFWALDSVSFDIKKGETLGLIGPNGSGKTTFLKMLNGIFWPDKGKITIKGRVGALIAVGAGFHPLLTGRENIYVNGAILGMGKREISKKFDAIVDFADIGDFLDSPVKHYSSGMYVRLGFAVAIHCDLDVLLVDEVLAVGDMNFQAKCMNKMEELSQKGTTKVFVSHDLNSVSRICTKALYLEDGKVKGYGDVIPILDQYKRHVVEEYKKKLTQSEKENTLKNHGIRYGTGEIEIVNVEFRDENGMVKEIFKRGEPFRIKISFRSHKKIIRPEFVIQFFTDNGTLVSQPSTKDHRVSLDNIQGSGELEYAIAQLPFNVGRYSITVAIWDFAGHLPLDVHQKLYDFTVDDNDSEAVIQERYGLVYIPAKWKWMDI